MKKLYLLVIFFLLLASIKYFYRFNYRAMFEFDHEYLASQAKLILVDKKFTLIGAPTSVGGMFIGPLYSYFMASAFALVKMNPYIVAFVSNFWAVLTLVSIFLVCFKLFGLAAAIFSFLLALASFEFLNQTGLPPLLFPLPLISLLLIYLLCQKRNHPILAGILVGIAINLHFTSFFFIPMTIIFLNCSIYKNIKKNDVHSVLKDRMSVFSRGKQTFITKLKLGDSSLKNKILPNLLFLATIGFFCLPLIFFDLRHNFFITKNFFNFLSQKETGEFNLLNQFVRALIISLNDLGNLLTPGLLPHIQIIIALVLIIITLVFLKNKIIKLLLAWVFLPIIFFSFYKNHIINYYFVIQEPIFFLLCGFIFSKLFQKFWGKLLTTALVIFVVATNFKPWITLDPKQALFYKMEALSFIKQKAQDKPFYLSYTIEPAWRGGWDYLVYYYHFNLLDKPTKPTYTLIQPHNWHNIKSDYIFGMIGVGVPK